MYIDTAREHDLKYLKAIRDDVTETTKHRRAAHMAYNKIMAQLRDPILAGLRERLMKAGLAQDKLEMWKIRNQIKDHLKEELFLEGR
jgi:hypothetical protein